jgi:TRAP-type C4-dicarboxylate transport system substrate-binding protein
MLDKRTFHKLTPEQQTIVQDVMGRVFREIERQNLDDNDKALAAIEKQGVDFLEVPDARMETWRTVAGTVADRLVEKNRLSREIVDRLEETLAEYHREKGRDD